jgi:hypothetical protein
MKEIQSRFIRVFLLAAVAGLLAISFSLPQPPLSLAPSVRAQASEPGFSFNEFLIEKPHFTLPFHLVDGLLIIDGQVNGVSGKFLFDTGTHFPFFLNNHRLLLSRDTFLARGTTASGQELVLYQQDSPVESITLADQITFEAVRSLPHTDWSFVEQALVESFLGTVGYGFNRNYRFVINYDTQIIDFYSLNQDDETLANALSLEQVVAILNFEPTGAEGNLPAVEFTIGDTPILGMFDTGDHGTLKLTQTLKTQLEREGYLTADDQDFLYGTYEPYVRATLKGLHHGDQPLADLHNLRLEVGEENQLVLGYQFLKHYVTAWDYQDQTITLLKR